MSSYPVIFGSFLQPCFAMNKIPNGFCEVAAFFSFSRQVDCGYLLFSSLFFPLALCISVFLSRACTPHLSLAIHIYRMKSAHYFTCVIVGFVVKSRKFQVGILCDDCHAIQTNSYFRNVPTKFEQFQKRIHFTVDRSCTYFVSFQCIQRMFAMQRKHRKENNQTKKKDSTKIWP